MSQRTPVLWLSLNCHLCLANIFVGLVDGGPQWKTISPQSNEFEDKPITLTIAKTIAGTCEQVEEVLAAIVNENSDKHISHHLTDVWAGLRGTLTGQQHRKVHGLLTEH